MLNKRGQVEAANRSKVYLIWVILAAVFVAGLVFFLVYLFGEGAGEATDLQIDELDSPDVPVTDIDWALLSNAPPEDEVPFVGGGGGGGGADDDGCGFTCGSGDCKICPNKCPCPPVCGDGRCDAPLEDVSTCRKDCLPCGNGVCATDETEIGCPEDCGFFKIFSHYDSKLISSTKIIKSTNLTSGRSSYYTQLLLKNDGIAKRRNLTFVFEYGGFPVKSKREVYFGYSGVSKLNFGIGNILMLKVIDKVKVFDDDSKVGLSSSEPRLLSSSGMRWHCGDNVCDDKTNKVSVYADCPEGFACENLMEQGYENESNCPKDCAPRVRGPDFARLDSSFLESVRFKAGLRDYTRAFVFPNNFDEELEASQISESVGKYNEDGCDAQKKIALDYPIGRPIVRDHGKGYCYGLARNYYPHPVGEGMFDAWAYCKNDAASGYCERLNELADFGVWQQYDSSGCSSFVKWYAPKVNESDDIEDEGDVPCNELYAGGWPSLSFDWTDSFKYFQRMYEPSHHVDAMESLGLLYAYNLSGNETYLNAVKLFLEKQRPRYAGGSGVYNGHEYTWDTYSPADGADATDIIKNSSVDNVQTLISAVYAAAGYYENKEAYLREAEKLLWYDCREFERDGRWFYHGDESWLDEAKAVSHDSAVIRDSLITLWFLKKANHLNPDLYKCYNRAYDFYLNPKVDINNYFRTIAYGTMTRLAAGESDSPFNQLNLNALDLDASDSGEQG